MIFGSKSLRALLVGASLSAGLVTVAVSPQAAVAQAISGDITGLVTDQAGAVVTKAQVTATNVATGVVSKATTNSVGQYRFVNLPNGSYDIAVSAAGFTKSTLKGFAVELNKVSTANFTLKVTASETVEVSSEAGVALDTTTAQLGSTYEAAQALDIPAATNEVLNLSLLSAGVSSGGGTGYGSGPSVGGQRPTSNNFTLEGVDNNDKSVTGPLVHVPSEAIAEFTVLQNQYSAEFGHSNGGQFNSVVKSGTNQFHGLGYEYSQNRNYNAVDSLQAYNNGKGYKPRFDDNRFGAQVGGPIKKDKLFFFTNYEQEVVGEPGSASSYCTPTAAGYTALNAIGSKVATNVNVLKQYAGVGATPSSTDTCNNTIAVFSGMTYADGIASGATATPIEASSVPIKAGAYTNYYRTTNSGDYTINNNDSVRVRYIYNRVDTIDTSASLPVFWNTIPYRYHLFTLSQYHTFSPNLTNEFRIGYNRFYNTTAVPAAKFPGMTVFPNLTVDETGLNIGPDPNAPQGTIQNTYQGTEGITWIKQKHTIKAGAEYRDVISPQLFVQRVRGDYEWSNLSDYINDYTPDVAGERNATSAGLSPTFYGNQQVFYAYFQDDYRLNRKLTLNAGVRYEWTAVSQSEKNQSLNSAASVKGLINFKSPTSQKLNFVPRVGFAYALNEQTAIRGGFGMGYDVLYDNLGTLSSPPQYQMTEDVPSTQTKGFLTGGALPANASFTTIAEQRAATSSYVPDQKLPYAENWSLGIERTIAKNYTAEIRYLGTRGIHLPAQIRMNRKSIVTNSNKLPFFYSATSNAGLTTTLDTVEGASDANGNDINSFVASYYNAGFNSSNVVGFLPSSSSNYNGMAAQLTRRAYHGLSGSIAYTWSKTMDDATATVFSTYLTPRRPQDSQNVKADYSRSALDHTQRLTVEAIYSVQFLKNRSKLFYNTVSNWQIAPVFTYQSPEFATVQSGIDVNMNGDSAGDRVFINPNGKKGTGSTSTPIINSSKQVVGYYATNPNAYYIKAGYGSAPNGGRNTLPIRPIDNLDATVAKVVSFGKQYSVAFRAQVWNVLNHSQYLPGSVNGVTLNSYTDTSVKNYLVPGTATFNHPEKVFSNNPRNMQLSLTLKF